ncbi:MAG TPA: hypothetical protein VF147_17395 [Vicinamibacterales bacterium]
MSDYYFEGDPSTDSRRRQLERLLHEQERGAPRRWRWLAALFAGGGSLYLWHLFGRHRKRT